MSDLLFTKPDITFKPIAIPKNAKYHLDQVKTSIYCSSMNNLEAEFIYHLHNGKGKLGYYRFGAYYETEPTLAKYMVYQIEQRLIELHRGNILRVYELNQERERRYTNLRYFYPEGLEFYIKEMEGRLVAS